MQAAYHLRVSEGIETSHRGTRLIWDSGKVPSDNSTHVRYAGPTLQSRRRYYWQVRIWDELGCASSWSELKYWEMGLLNKSDWQAHWISPIIDPNRERPTPPTLLRSTFQLRGKVRRARAYITSLGAYELHLNGTRVGDALLTPGWTSFDKRLQYQSYEVDALLAEGGNAVGVILGDGWYRRTPFNRNRQQINGKIERNNGRQPSLLLQIEVTYEDGSTQIISSDCDWKTTTGPILLSEIHNGEIYDARRERAGWTLASYQENHNWVPVELGSPSAAVLVSSSAPPIRKVMELKPIRIFTTPDGSTAADMGQNMVGWVRLRVRGPRGTTVTLRHAEVLDQSGNLYFKNLRNANPVVQYTLAGKDEEIFEPHFAFQGFRYVSVENYPGPMQAEHLTGVVIQSDLECTGALHTSNSAINRLQENIVWTMRGNFIEVPTDCPQRDERLGWGLDAERISRTAALNMDVALFFSKWLADLAADQSIDGAVPIEIPRTNWLKYQVKDVRAMAGETSDDTRLVEFCGVPCWSDVATMVPWNLYLAYGDEDVLRAQYASMKRWVQYVHAQVGDCHIWEAALTFGDWLDYETTVKPGWFGSNAHDLMSTAYYANSVRIVAQSAALLGDREDAIRYSELLKKILQSFQERFISSDGRVSDGKQASYVFVLDFDLLPASLRSLAAAHLAADIRTRGHLTTGTGATARLLNVLSRYGYHEEAYMLLLREEMPSWLYCVNRGATTVWERWDGIRPDGSFQDPAMNSFNQFTLAGVGEWMYNTMAGIAVDPAGPGYKRILFQPKPGGGLTYVEARHYSPYGEISSSWRIEPGTYRLAIRVPPNSSATVTLPSVRLEDVMEGGRSVAGVDGVRSVRQDGRHVVVEVGSGEYNFSYPIDQDWRPLAA